MKMYVAGQWLDKAQKIEVRNSYDESLIDTVPRADATDVERALQSAERGAKAMAKLTAFERWKILHTAAETMAARVEELGALISKEVRKITFTGSRDIGERICKTAGIKRVTMELGSNSPVVVMPDADLDKVAAAVAATGYANAGQVCISTQRVLTAGKVYGNFLDALRPKVAALKVGNQLDPAVQMGPMIREKEAIRVEEWVRDAVASGARLVTGGRRQGALYEPTIVADVKPEMRISCDELFGPAVAVTPFNDLDEAIALANDTNYGLAAGIFTENLEWAWRFAREGQSGNLHVNWWPQWRADRMPYGGLKESGFGKEGPAYAINEMTELKMVVFHLSS